MARSGAELVPSSPPPSPDPQEPPPIGPRRLAALLLARRDQLLRSRRRRGSSCSSCGRNAASVSESESLGSSSKRHHDTISRNSSSGQSATTLQTVVASPHKDGHDKRISRYEDLGDDNVLDGLQVIAEKEMNSFQRHIPGLQRHDVKTSTIRQHYYPEGGWGWVVCGCVFAVQVLTSGLQFSFGVLYTDLVAHVGKPKALQACWVGASCLAVSRASSPFIVAFCRRKSTRLTAVIGGLVVALAVLFTSFALHLHQVFLSWGIVLGIGIGMTRETSNLMLGQYFKRRREFVEIISQSGCGVGITLFSVFFKESIRAVGWRLGLQAVTGAVFSAFFLGIFYRSASLYHPQRRAILHLKNQKKKQVKDKKKLEDKPPYFDVSSLKLKYVQIILLSLALISAGVYAPLFFLIIGAQDEGLEDSSLIILQTFLGFAYALGCIGVGVIIVKRSAQCMISKQYLCQASFFGLGVTILSLTAVRGYYGYVLFMWLYGLQLGAAHYSIKMLTLEKVRARQFSRAWGFIQGGTALPILFGVPITGYINSANAKMGYFLSSALTILGAGTLFLLNYYKKPLSNPETNNSFTTLESHMSQEPQFPQMPHENGGKGIVDPGCLPPFQPPLPPTAINLAAAPFREPICTCGAEANVPIVRPGGGMTSSCQPNAKRWGKNISFASSVDIMENSRANGGNASDEALFDRYCEYTDDCTTTCNKVDNYFPFSEFDRECLLNQMGDTRNFKEDCYIPPTYYPSQHKPMGTSSLRRTNKLRNSSAVSFSEPEGLARIGECQEIPNDPYSMRYQAPRVVQHPSGEFSLGPQPAGPPCYRGSLPRPPRRPIHFSEEITTSV